MKKIILVALFAMVLAVPALALEKMSGSDLGGVVGQAGVTIGFCGTSTTTIDFSKISWGDPDGANAVCGSLAGWVIISGTVTISQTIADGQELSLDIGRTAAATCDVCGGAGNVMVPINTVFIMVDLPTVSTQITVPTTMVIGLGSAAGTISATIGILNLTGLSVTQGTAGALVIWAHP